MSTVFTVWHLNFLETVNKTSNLAIFLIEDLAFFVTGKPGITGPPTVAVVMSRGSAFNFPRPPPPPPPPLRYYRFQEGLLHPHGKVHSAGHIWPARMPARPFPPRGPRLARARMPARSVSPRGHVWPAAGERARSFSFSYGPWTQNFRRGVHLDPYHRRLVNEEEEKKKTLRHT